MALCRREGTSLDRLFGANRNGDWWRWQSNDLAIDPVGENCSENSLGTSGRAIPMSPNGPWHTTRSPTRRHPKSQSRTQVCAKAPEGTTRAWVQQNMPTGDLLNKHILCLFYHIHLLLLKKGSSCVLRNTAQRGVILGCSWCDMWTGARKTSQ